MTINARKNVKFWEVAEGQSFYLGPKASFEFEKKKGIGVARDGRPTLFRENETVWINVEEN